MKLGQHRRLPAIAVLGMVLCLDRAMGQEEATTLGPQEAQKQKVEALVDLIGALSRRSQTFRPNAQPPVEAWNAAPDAGEAGRDPDAVHKEVRDEFAAKEHNLAYLERFGFNNAYALVMRPSQAGELKIETVSELAKCINDDLLPELRAAFNGEFLYRRPKDGCQALARHYGFEFPNSPTEMDHGDLYKALADGEVNLIDGFATDGQLSSDQFVALKDDKQFFPPYEPAPLVRVETLEEHPNLKGILKELTDTIRDEQTMRNLNNEAKKQGAAATARRFLTDTGLVLADANPGDGLEGKIVVGGKDFSEQRLLCELMACAIECNSGIEVERKLDFGGTMMCFYGLGVGGRAGGMDLYAEYTGTGLHILGDMAVDRERFLEKQADLAGREMATALFEMAKQRERRSLRGKIVRSELKALKSRREAEELVLDILRRIQEVEKHLKGVAEAKGPTTPGDERWAAEHLPALVTGWREKVEKLERAWKDTQDRYVRYHDRLTRTIPSLRKVEEEDRLLRFLEGRSHDASKEANVIRRYSQEARREGKRLEEVENRASEWWGIYSAQLEERAAGDAEAQARKLAEEAGALEAVAESIHEVVKRKQRMLDDRIPERELEAAESTRGRLEECEWASSHDVRDAESGRAASLRAALRVGPETVRQLRHLVDFVKQAQTKKESRAKAMQDKAAEIDRGFKLSLWTAAGAGGVSLFLIVVSWVVLRRRELRVARALAAMVLLLIGGAVAAMQFEASRRVGVSFLASAGVAGVVIGIAARSTLANVFSGVMIFLSRAIRIGDTVVIDGKRGTIEDMTLMYTAFRTWDHRRVMIPNEKMNDKQIVNCSIRDAKIRAKVPIHLDYTADLARAEEILLEIAGNSEHRSKAPESDPVVWPMSMDEQAVLLWVAVWADNPDEEWALKCEILKKALARFREEGIPLPRQRYERLEPGGGTGDEPNA